MFAVDLPWPHRDLHPNSRGHWAKRKRAAKQARAEAGWQAKASGLGPMDCEAMAITAIFTPPDSRRRDTDGMLSNIKSYLDGIADVVGVDDSKWTFAIRRLPPAKPGNVRIEIKEVSA